MTKNYGNLYAAINGIGDFIILNIAYIIGNYILSGNFENFYDLKYLLLWFYLNIIYFLSAFSSGSLGVYRNTRFSQIFNKLMFLIFLQIVLSFSYIVVFKDFNGTFKISRAVLLWTYCIASIATIIWRFGFIKIVRFYRARGINNKSVVVVGAGKSGQEVKKMLMNKQEYGFRFVGYFDDEPEKFEDIRSEILGSINDVKKYCINNNIEEIFCALPNKYHKKIKKLIEFAGNNCIRLKIVPDFNIMFDNKPPKNLEIQHFGTVPIIAMMEEPLENALNRIIKRGMDLGFTIIIMLPILIILIPLIALLIKLDSPGPIFFIQERSGEMNKPFNVIKFRTMKINDEAHVKQATKGDDRITRVGRVLRKYSLDEFPQFINVFNGTMSVIGPRPHMVKHTQEYSKIVDNFMIRHLVKPGITGWAQVNGLRGETEDPKKMSERIEKDVYYVENWSPLLDLKITFKTLFNLTNGE